MDFGLIKATDLPDSDDYEVVPEGIYHVFIESAETKKTKAGNGMYIKLKLKIMNTEHAGKVIFTILNIRNQNETAQNIGLAQLKKVMIATNKPEIKTEHDLVNGEMQITVAIRPGDGQYGPQNDVKKFESIPRSMPSQPKPQGTLPDQSQGQSNMPFGGATPAQPQPQQASQPPQNAPWA